jgi:lipopolysaccharide heptosyltransferase II
MINNWKQCKKILCVRLDNIGDLLMTTPAIRALRESDPKREIALLASSGTAKAVELIPDINDVIVYDAPWMKASSSHDVGVDMSIIETLKERQFDAAIIFTVFSQNPLPAAMLCYLAQIPLRLAYCHENPYQLLTDWIPDPDPQLGIRHEVQRQLELVRHIDCLSSDQKLILNVPWDAQRSVEEKLEQKGIYSFDQLIVIHPGATAPSRRYPADKFIKVASSLIKSGYHVVFTGQEEERVLIEEIQDGLDVSSRSFIGSLSFAELCALIFMSRLLITNNTAPAHISSAVGTPVVDLYALTNPQHTPWQVPHRVLSHDVPCKFCFKSICTYGHHHCLDLIPWEEVVEAVEDLIKETEYVYARN